MIIVKVRLFSWKHAASHLIGAMLVPRLVMSRSLEPFGRAFRFSYFSALILMSKENGLGPIRPERATMRDLEKARVQMVEQLVHRGIHDAHVLDAMGTVAREKFIDEGFIEFAYEDTPLPIKNGQTISQPYMTAFMIASAHLGGAEHVLEIGTGSGYAAAIIAQIAGQIFTVERYSTLAEAAQQRFEDLGCDNIHVRTGDGSNGWPEEAPFDAIIVAAGAPEIPSPLKEQLKPGGRLIIPVGSMAGAQRLLCITRKSTEEFNEEDLGGVMFVPLVGDKAWPDMN